MMMVLFLLISSLLALFLPLNEAFVPQSPDRRKSTTLLLADATTQSLDDCLLKGAQTMAQVMTPEFFESSPSLKTMHSTICKNVEIKESSIPNAGLGLFAKKNLKSGTIVSFYPAHSLGVDGQAFVSGCPEDQEYFQAHPADQSSYLHCTDQPLFQRTSLLAPSSDELLFLDVNPHKEVVPGWVSQYINDGAVVKANSEQGLLDYYRDSGLKKNCIHIPWGPSPVMATVTTKKVKKGQELLTSYGGTYWLGVYLNVHGEEGVPITDEIQKKIQETATDLRKSMQAVSVVYATQAEEMTVEFDILHNQS